MTLSIVPITIGDARKWIERHHSHHHAPLGGLCAVAIAEDGRVCCVGMLSHPVARKLHEKRTIAEINRVASDGTAPHAASKAIGALSRAAIALGYRRLVSYTLLGEAGTSYRAAGWWPTSKNDGGDWSVATRKYVGKKAVQPGAKVRWEFGPDAEPIDPEVDALVRASVGVVALRGRAETLPLFATREREEAQAAE